MKQTQKSLLSAAVLLVVVGAVGGAALWVKKDEAQKEEKKEKEAKLFSFEKAKVRTVRLEMAEPAQLRARAWLPVPVSELLREQPPE